MSARDLTPEEVAAYDAPPETIAAWTKLEAELNAAFAQAQAEMPNASLNKVNPHFNSRYADLASIREATLPSLTKYGLSLRQFCELNDDGTKLVLVTRLGHKSGGYEDSRYPIALDRPQAMGSSLTYARRYNWAGMCGVGFEEDDDANEAERPQPTPKTRAKTKAQEVAEKNHEALESLLGETTTQKEVDAFIGSYRTQIDELPTDLKDIFRDTCRRHRAGLAE